MDSGDFFQLIESYPKDRRSVVAIGVFDGVHRGHQKLLRGAIERARERGLVPIVVTFDPRPREVLRPDQPSKYLLPFAERLARFAEMGFEYCGIIHFSKEIAQTAANTFVTTLVEGYCLSELWVGEDFALGRGRQGTIPVLSALGEELDYTVRVVQRLALDEETVSSTRIFNLLHSGDVRGVELLLGRPYQITGKAVRGFGRGRTINLPTANIDFPPLQALPANGVYAVRALIDGETKLRPGVANIGIRPTFDAGAPTLEVHLLDYTNDLYDRLIRVDFVERLRPEVKFSSLEDFLGQIAHDIARARPILEDGDGPDQRKLS